MKENNHHLQEEKTANGGVLLQRNPYVVTIVQEMCRRVGADPSIVGWRDTEGHDPNWYYRHTWTEEQEKDFIDWLTKYLMGNKEARSVFDIWHKTKKRCKEAAEGFVWNYGWATERKVGNGLLYSREG